MRRAPPAAALLLAALLAACAEEPVNGCTASAAVDATGRPEVEIGFGGVHGYNYVPACVRVSAGTRLVFRGPFATHPLGAGRVDDGIRAPAPGNPVGGVERGEEAAFAAAQDGRFGFFCQLHVGEGMMGAVFVE